MKRIAQVYIMYECALQQAGNIKPAEKRWAFKKELKRRFNRILSLVRKRRHFGKARVLNPRIALIPAEEKQYRYLAVFIIRSGHIAYDLDFDIIR